MSTIVGITPRTLRDPRKIAVRRYNRRDRVHNDFHERGVVVHPPRYAQVASRAGKRVPESHLPNQVTCTLLLTPPVRSDAQILVWASVWGLLEGRIGIRIKNCTRNVSPIGSAGGDLGPGTISAGGVAGMPQNQPSGRVLEDIRSTTPQASHRPDQPSRARPT